jgi:hypothetical protein
MGRTIAMTFWELIVGQPADDRDEREGAHGRPGGGPSLGVSHREWLAAGPVIARSLWRAITGSVASDRPRLHLLRYRSGTWAHRRPSRRMVDLSFLKNWGATNLP